MGCSGRTESDLQADRFFAGFANATPKLIAAVELERGGDLTAVVAESVGYWDRKMAVRAKRRDARERARAAERARLFAASALASGPDERARLTPVAESSRVVLPVPRFVLLTDAEYEDTRRWWLRLENPSAARGLAIRVRREIREAAREQRAASRAAGGGPEGRRRVPTCARRAATRFVHAYAEVPRSRPSLNPSLPTSLKAMGLATGFDGLALSWPATSAVRLLNHPHSAEKRC